MSSKWYFRFVLLMVVVVLLTGCNLPQTLPSPSAASGSADPGAQPSTPKPADQSPQASPTAPAPESPPSSPTASPTGPIAAPVLQIAYVKEGSAWLWKETGAPVELVTGGITRVLLSEDGMLAAYLRQVGEFSLELRVINTDGTGDRLLLAQEDFDALEVTGREPFALAVQPFDLQWVPGTHTLVFNTHQIFQGPGLSIFDDLRLVDAETGALSTLLPAGSAGRFYYSPDGSQIALVTPTQISLVNADGTDLRPSVLTYPEVLTYSEYRFYPVPVWSSDGSFLRVSIPPMEPLEYPHRLSSLWHIPASGSPAASLGGIAAISLWGGSPSFSPDLTRIAYLRQTPPMESNLREIHIAASDGTGDVLFHTFEAIELLGWSPDSSRVLFKQGSDQRLMAGGLDGTLWILVGEPGLIVDLTWIDATRFVFTRINPGDIWELRLGTESGTVLLDSSPAMINEFDYSLH